MCCFQLECWDNVCEIALADKKISAQNSFEKANKAPKKWYLGNLLEKQAGNYHQIEKFSYTHFFLPTHVSSVKLRIARKKLRDTMAKK